MRENPWHLRAPNTEHYQWFENLVDLHGLTTLWIQEIQSERAPYLMTRGLSAEASENLWMLDSLSERKLESLLDDTSIHDLLCRLEHAVWAAQAWTLKHLLEKPADQ